MTVCERELQERSQVRRSPYIGESARGTDTTLRPHQFRKVLAVLCLVADAILGCMLTYVSHANRGFHERGITIAIAYA
jgi:hypothetical protein